MNDNPAFAPCLTPEVAPAKEGGATMIEVLVAILIFSLGILGLVGSQAASIQLSAQSKYRADATFLANRILGELWSGTKNDLSEYDGVYSAASNASKDWAKAAVATLPQGSATVTIAGDTATITVTWKAPEDPTTRKFSQTSRIRR